MIMCGWIKLHRKFTEWEWYTDLNTSRVFMHLLLVANYKDSNHRGVLIKRGQKLTSYASLGKQCGLTPKQIRRSINNLVFTGELGSVRAGNGLLLTIIKYDSYQSDDNNGADLGHNLGQTEGRPRATNKEVKKERIINTLSETKVSNPCPAQEIVGLYHKILPELPSVRTWKSTDKRAKHLAARWKESEQHQSLDFWEWFFLSVRNNPHWLGQNQRGWKANLEWLVNRTNFLKVVEQ